MSRLVAIHQPNFFPWLGYFDKIRRADAFVFLDVVDYARSGSGGMGSWTNRVRLNIQGEAKWVTCPARRVGIGTPINQVLIDDGQPWRAKLLKTLETNYRKAPRYGHAMTFIERIVMSQERHIAAFNMSAIRSIANELGLTTHFLLQSELEGVGKATDLLVSLVRAAGGDGYLAGGGAAGYQQDAVFADAGLDLIYQNFVPRLYGDKGRFLPGLSVIDYLMHDGRPLEQAFPTQ